MSQSNLLMPRSLSRSDVYPRYDVVICALGYESRARYLAESLGLNADLKLALAFSDCKTHAYLDNRQYFENADFNVIDLGDEEFRDVTKKRLEEFVALKDNEVTICLDISSFSRVRLAYLVDILFEVAQHRTLRLHVVYNIAMFSPPDREDVPIRTAAPVTDRYAGWSKNLDCPTVAIVGLGYEHGRALGAVEYLQADEIWVFDPYSPIDEYRDALNTANNSLLEAVPNTKKINYDVMNPNDLFIRLESLVYGLITESRPIILPFGPKIFSLVSLLVAQLHPQLAVWRVSGGEPEEPMDRKPSKSNVYVEYLLCAKSASLPGSHNIV